MEYFSSGDTEGMSLEDMINCDIKSEFSEHSHTTGDGMRILSGPLTPVEMNGTNVSSYDSSVHTSANTTSGLDLTPQDAMLNTDADPRLGSDCNWMQNINVNSLRQLFQPQQQQQVSSQVRVGTPEPSILMVNPQTGLPVQNRQVSSPVSRAPPTPQQNSSTTAQAHSAIQAALLQTTPQIQYITINNIAGLPSASVQNFGTQGNLINSNLSPMQISYAHTNGMSQVTQQLLTTNHSRSVPKAESQDKIFPKPVYSYSCLIALALKNSENGCLPVSEIYNFMTENFPYFKTAPDGWKNSVRHNLSLNKCFAKIENPKANGSTKKGCLWGLNPDKIEKMEEELAKWRKKDPVAIKKSMAKPDILEQLERGIFKVKMKHKPGYEAAPPIVDLPPIKVEPIHIEPVADPVIRIKEVKVHEGNGNTLLSTVNADDLNLLDNGLTLDPSLHDLALQGEILDDLTHDVFKMDPDLPMSSGTSSQGIPSPLTIVSSPSSAQNEMGQVSATNGTYQGAYTYTNFNTSNQVTTNGYSVSRTVSAQT